jgi:hypothetical protein
MLAVAATSHGHGIGESSPQRREVSALTTRRLLQLHPAVAEDGILADVHILSRTKERQESRQIAAKSDRSDEAAQVVCGISPGAFPIRS